MGKPLTAKVVRNAVQKRVGRIKREKLAETRHAEPPPPLDDADCRILPRGDFRDALADEDLSGAIVISDPPSSVFKAITGGDAIEGERKYATAFSFRPYARLLFSANDPPPTPDSSDAFFRRWLPFEHRFDGRKADRQLLARLTTPSELSGLLNHGIEALPELRRRGGFATTDASESVAERFRTDADSVAGFLADACVLDPGTRTPKPRMFDAYRLWCTDSNRKPLGKQKFNRRVEALRPSLDPEAVYQGARCWGGIRVEGP